MRATGWNNGSCSASGAGYGLRVSREDRDRYFDATWEQALFHLDGETVVIARLSPSFWRSCSELRSAELGKWFRHHGVAPWPKGRPPELEIRPMGGNRFSVDIVGIGDNL